VHGLVLKEPLAPIIKVIYWLAEWFAHKLRDVTICVSEDDRRAAIRAHIAKPQNTVTIPVGIDRDIPFLSKEEARKALVNRHPPLYSPLFRGETNGEGPLPNKGEDGGEGVWIGAIAGLYATKGLETLLAAARRLIQVRANGRSPLQFIIIGEGPERKKLEHYIAANHLQKNCHLLGHIPDAALYLKAFDCFALPSLKEGLPYTILEALAAQIPIIATRVGGIPEVMEESATHHLINPNNPTALTQAILSVLSATSTVRESPPKPIPTLQTMIEATEDTYNH
jgi:glycosyltransferase involved in cell wall biosynthesis